ncbi:ABC transporter permease [Gordoniibacillus kamchatkensis]|uniref:ABC transporter permease n=1 Tax=Gordoniibacillus kamchatkensis TaxID=1590651 RepID=A0ABR5AHT7_9BACL|nr:carbohydrate ABC transporter permease [Paenibacillus sp. VKM B-2647]KIL40603.1 ABC transporter permease [Paenibacillus sp. VKM B-2647]
MVISGKEKMYLLLIYGLLTLFALSIVFPLLYVVSVSVTPYSELVKHGGFVVVPSAATLDAYRIFLSDSIIPNAYRVTVFITVVGTAVNLALTSLMAYPLSKKFLPGRNVLLFLVVFTFLFNAGIIPTYLIVKATGLINSVWAMIVPLAVYSYNLLIMKTFFENLPESLYEAARIDGAGELRIFIQLVLPLSMPIMATIGLFYAVGHWNEFFQGIMYINESFKQPLQVVLRGILTSATNPNQQAALEQTLPTESLQMAAVVLTALPILIVYPFVQKYFTQGVLLGSIKG